MVKNLPSNAGDARYVCLIPGLARSLGEKNDNPLQCSCLENPHGQKSLAGYSPWGCKESDTTEDYARPYETHTVSSLESALALCLPLEMAPAGKLFSMIGFDSGGVEGRKKPSSWFRSMEGR